MASGSTPCIGRHLATTLFPKSDSNLFDALGFLEAINRAAAIGLFAGAGFGIRVVGSHIVQRNLFARMNVTKRKEDQMTVYHSHKAVRLARVVDIMCAVSAATTIYIPVVIYSTDAQLAGRFHTPRRFSTRNQLARILGDLTAFAEKDICEAALAIDCRSLDDECWRQACIHVHLPFHLIAQVPREVSATIRSTTSLRSPAFVYASR